MEKLNLLVLFGGKSAEYEVSLVSASSIIRNADTEKYNLITVGITKDGDWYLYDGDTDSIRNGGWCADTSSLEPAMISSSMSDHSLIIFKKDGGVEKKHIDVIFPVMHGAYSEDGTLQGLLQMSGIPFVGCKCTTSAIGMDKGYTKMILKGVGIHMARSIVINAAMLERGFPQILERCEQMSPYPLFVKPANAGSSVGASKVTARDRLLPAMYEAAKYDSKIVVEEFIKGKECEVAVMGKKNFIASTVGEIVPGSEFYDYDTKYSSGSTASYNIPASIREDTQMTIRRTAIQICSVLGVEGLSRVDFFVRKRGQEEEVIFNEINTLPGFTEISMYPKLFMHDGMTYAGIIDRLVNIALGKDELA